jgi:hypothetical protein
MAEPKTKVNDASVAKFLNAIPDPQTRSDCRTIADIMQAATKAEPRMWGTGIVGFGTRRVVYAGGREADWMVIGFAPRKQNIVLYIGLGGEDRSELLAGLGKHDVGKGCLYVKRLSDVHLPTLKSLVRVSVKNIAGAGSGARSKRSGA